MSDHLPQLIEQPETMTPWSKELGRLLLLEGDDPAGRAEVRDRALAAIKANPSLRREASEIVAHLESRKRPASRDEIIAQVARHMPAWGVAPKTAEVWGVTYSSYADALAGMPLYAIEQAIIRWNRGDGQKDSAAGGFPPRPAQLFKLADEAKRELHMAAYRAKLVLRDSQGAYGEEWTPERKKAERQKMIDQGLLTKDGKPNFAIGGKGIPSIPRKESPQELAAQLRASAGQARSFGAPVSRADIQDPGDVV